MPTVDFSGMLVSRVLAILRSRYCTGELYVVSTYRKVKFQLDTGKVTAIQSNRPADRLGMQMMKAGDIGVIDLHGALVEQHQQRLQSIASDSQTSRLGEILVDQNVLNPRELDEALGRYVKSMAEALDKDFVIEIQFNDARGQRNEVGAQDWNMISVD